MSYILVLAVLAAVRLKPGPRALRRPLRLASLPEQMTRLRRVREGFVGLDLARESLIQ